MKFVAFDVETATPDLASICQIGVVVFEGGRVAETWESLINPGEPFHPANVSVHGICGDTVKDAPSMHEVFERLGGYLNDQVVVHHTAFDRVSIARAASKHGLGEIRGIWLDTARVVRRTWPQFSRSGYGLKNVASHLGIEFRHHSAGEDARAAGEILLRAVEESSVGLEEWFRQPIGGRSYTVDHRRDGEPDGPLSGEVIVFTGSLSMSRTDAADKAARAGCDVGANVTKATTVVVVEGIDISERANHEKSNKHRKAEDLIAKGQAIRILTEDDFARLIAVG